MDENNKGASKFIESKTHLQNWPSNRPTRPKKYSPSTKSETDYVVLDFETTGLRAGADQIIQVGAVKYINHEQVDMMNLYVNPMRSISTRITSLTGITNDSLKNKPPIYDVIPGLINFIGELPIVAHNASFDMSFLYALDNFVKIPRYTVIDTLKLARQTIKQTPNHKLSTLANYLQIEYHAHDALEDCLVTAKIYQYCLNQST